MTTTVFATNEPQAQSPFATVKPQMPVEPTRALPKMPAPVALNHVIFNPSSVDSLLAAACLYLMKCKDPIKPALVSYDRFEGLDRNRNYAAVTIVGVELTPSDTTWLLDRTKGEGVDVHVYAYKMQYRRDPILYTRMCEQWTFFAPNDEHFSDIDDLCDNSMVRMVQHNHGEQTKIFGLFTTWSMAVAWHVSNKQRKLDYKDKSLVIKRMPAYNDHDHYRARNKQVVNTINEFMMKRVAMKSLRGMLSTCASHSKTLSMLVNGVLEVNDSSIQQHRDLIQSVRVNVKKNLIRTYVGGSFFNKKDAVEVGTMPVADNLFHDTMLEARRYVDIFVGYEDTKEYRIHRIAADDPYVRERVARELKAKDIWTEGNILCVATRAKKVTSL